MQLQSEKHIISTALKNTIILLIKRTSYRHRCPTTRISSSVLCRALARSPSISPDLGAGIYSTPQPPRETRSLSAHSTP